MSANGFQDDSSECSSDEYEIVSHQSEDQLDEESVSGSARDEAEMTDEIVSHGSVNGEEERDEEHDLAGEDRDDDGLEEEKDQDILNMAEEPAGEDSGELGSAATIVPSQSEDNAEEDEFNHVDENGTLLFKEMKHADRDDIVLGIMKEHSDDDKASSVFLPMSTDRLSVTKPFHIYYGGPRSVRRRVIEKIGKALAMSDVVRETDLLGNPERFDIFNVSPADINDPEVELVRSANVRMHVSELNLKREHHYDLVVLIDDSTTAFDQHKCMTWDLPMILIGSSDKTLSRITASGGLMLLRVHDDLNSVTADPEALRLKRELSPVTPVNLEFFESIDAEQLNRHIAGLVERQERAAHRLQISALGAAVNGFLTDANDTVYEVRSYIDHSIRNGLHFCRTKVSGSASNMSLPMKERFDITPKQRVSADPGKWLRTLITLLGTFMLLRLSTYAVGALVINPSMAVGSFVGSNTMSYFHDNCNQSSVASSDITADAIKQVQITTTAISPSLGQTQAAFEPRSDIMPVYGSEVRALAQHPGHKDQQPCKKRSRKCRVTTWTMEADNEKLTLTPTSKTSWGRAPCEPALVAVDQSGSLLNTTLVKINSELYELMIGGMPAKEVLLVSAMLDDGYLIKGHLISKIVMTAVHNADANATAIAIDYVLSHRSSYTMDLLEMFHKELESLETAFAVFESKVQGGAAVLREKCNRAISSPYPRAKVPEKDSTSAITKENSVAKLSYFDTKAIAAAYRTQVGRVDELKSSAWSNAQDMFSRTSSNPTEAAARDFVQEFQHKSRAAVEKMQKDTLAAVKKASGRAKTLKAGLKKKTTGKMPKKEAKPVPYGRRA